MPKPSLEHLNYLNRYLPFHFLWLFIIHLGALTPIRATEVIIKDGLRILQLEVLECCASLYEDTYYLIDNQTHSIDEILSGKSDSLFKLSEDLPSSLNVPEAYWGKLYVLFTPKAREIDWSIYFQSNVRQVDFYIPKPDGWDHYQSGSLVPEEVRTGSPPPIPVLGHFFDIEGPLDSVITLYFKIHPLYPSQHPIPGIMNRGYFSSFVFGDSKRIMFFTGSIGILLLYAFALYLFIRERLFLYYVLFLASILIYVWYSEGYLYRNLETLFPSNPGFKYYVGLIFYPNIIFYLAFVRSFLNLKKLLPRWETVFKLLIWGGVFLFFLSCLILYLTHYKINITYLIFIIYGSVSSLAAVILLFPLSRKEGKSKFYIICGLIPLVVGALPNIVHLATGTYSKLDLLYYELGFIGQAVIFSFGLAHRQFIHSQEAMEAKRLRELDRVKTQLYTNITHEFRTPLTVILGMVDRIQGNEKEKKLISRNGRNLLNLINQILDLRKLESGHVPVRWVQGDIIQYLRYIQESFQSYAEMKNIRLHFLAELETLEMDYDEEKILNIISNLLSNAIKFTPADGDVYLRIEKESQATQSFLKLEVKDTGIGISKEQLPEIFNRFFQVDDTNTRKEEGTGIGLSLTKGLVELLHGDITVKSSPGNGSTFTVLIPILHKAKHKANPTKERLYAVMPPSIEAEKSSTEQAALINPSEDQPLILVIEDNTDVAEYIASCLPEHYQLHFATDGQTGIEKAIALTPDVIISDVMMPKKDGFEVCNTLKNDQRTSHIPIILLTAKVDVASRLTGLQRGADAYLAKPFNKEELQIRIEKLVESRQKLRHYYFALAAERGFSSETSTDQKEEIEDAFVKQVRHIVEANIAEPNFTVSALCRDVGMSHSQLHRKLTALTGQSVTKLVRSIKLNKAKELLKDTDDTIVSIAYDCGFNDHTYFHRVFKSAYGLTPNEFRSSES